MKEDGKTEAIKKAQQGLFDKIRVIMTRNPRAINNSQMKWILNLNKSFKNKGLLSQKQYNVLKDISVQVAYTERVMTK